VREKETIMDRATRRRRFIGRFFPPAQNGVRSGEAERARRVRWKTAEVGLRIRCMIEFTEEQAARFCRAAHAAAENGLLRYSSGNLSWRFAPGAAALTAKGSWLGELSPEEIALYGFEEGKFLTGVAPSVEAGFHLGIYRADPEAKVVLHFQSPAATALACMKTLPERFDVIPEIPFYAGGIGVVDYLPPGSPELAEAVIESAGKHKLIIMRNHGQVAVGKSLKGVLQMAGFFELACEIMLRNGEYRLLSPGDVEELRARARKLRPDA